MKIIINMLYWDAGDEQRLKNTKMGWHYLNKFYDYANEQGLDLSCFLFDYSNEQVLDDAIHIPYPKGVYKRAEKINKVIEYHKDNEEYIFSVIDSDLIIKPKIYDDLIYLLKELTKERFFNNRFYVFNLDDLINLEGVDFEKNEINFDKIQVQQRDCNPDLGALFFLSNKMIESVGGFDERFICYGGEDNKISYKLQKKGYKRQILPVKPIHLYHENLLKSVINTKQYQEQVRLLSEI